MAGDDRVVRVAHELRVEAHDSRVDLAQMLFGQTVCPFEVGFELGRILLVRASSEHELAIPDLGLWPVGRPGRSSTAKKFWFAVERNVPAVARPTDCRALIGIEH